MKKYSLLILLAVTLCNMAHGEVLWMRYPAISPDGSTIAFSYKGDIYTVSSKGGVAHQLTTNAAYDAAPVWSPDGTKIAFASAREGSMDVYVMSCNGGTPTRLTTNSANEMPITFKDNNTLLVEAALRPSAQSVIFPLSIFSQVYEVSLDGGRPRLFSPLTMCDISVNGKGEMLYHDMKGYEDPWRKHHTSSVARDIWMLKDGAHTKLTTFAGEDRNPVWYADGEHFAYLSEADGTFNVYRRSVKGEGGAERATQLTRFTQNPVRYLTMSSAGTLCFTQDGSIYTMAAGAAEPTKLNVTVVTDKQDQDLVRKVLRSGARNISVSPDGKEVAFVAHGDVYVTSTEYATTRRITDTPEQERTVAFSPDGRSIVYDSERDGLWQIYIAKIKNSDEKSFTYATDIVEEQLVDNGCVSLQPEFSPDGKLVAFFKNRADLCVVDVKTRAERTVMDGKYNFSYSDGDLWFQWSPDSRWLLASYIGTGGWNSPDIALVPADGSQKIVNVTESGYSEGNAKWVLGGKAMMFESDRAGFRSHGSWGAESDYYIMFFDQDAYEKFLMTKEEKELLAEAEKEKKAENDKASAGKDKQAKKGNGKAKGKNGGKNAAAKPAVKPLVLDLDNCRDRTVRLTVNSSSVADAILSVTGDTLYYETRFEGGYDLWRRDLKEEKTERVLKGVAGTMQTDKKMKNIFVAGQKGIQKIDFKTATAKPVSFEADFNYRPYQERLYMFNHIWRQVKEKFYIENMHNTDWERCYKTYVRFLPHINNNYDFRDMLSEMLGELNASHTGARYYGGGAAMQTASLGIFTDDSYEGEGIRVEEVIPNSPLALKQKNVKRGTIITAIDGQKIAARQDYNAMLDGKAGKRVRLTIRDPKTGKTSDIVTKPLSARAENELLYRRWVDRNRHLVDSLSNGQLAYVHVKEMNSESFRTVYRELLSDKNRNRKAAIVDERHNGGGWLHDDLCTLLAGKEYHQFVPHGKYVGSDPFNKWTKPSCVLVCENDYSNGHGFPWVYKTLGIGKVIGAPVPGTMTAVWWETLIDDTMIFGIPQVGCRDMNGTYGENTQLEPDIKVYNTPEDLINGHDRQLETAVREMMK